MKLRTSFVLPAVAMLALAACDDDTTGPMVSEAQDFEVTIENVSAVNDFTSSGIFAVPAGQGAAGPLLPGQTYEVAFSAAPGPRSWPPTWC